MPQGFTRVSIQPIAAPDGASTALLDVVRQFNERLNQIVRQTNDAITSGSAGLIDIARLGQIRLASVPASGRDDPEDIDVVVDHSLGRAPRYFLPLRRVSATRLTVDPMGGLYNSPTQWTDRQAFFRASHNSWTARMQYDVLLIP